MNPGEYVGIELPYIAAITAIDAKFNANLTVEYSQDGEKWSTTPSPCRYVRYINSTSAVVPMKMDKFDVTANLSGANGTENLFDGNLATTYKSEGTVEIIIPDGVKECTILMRSAEGVEVVQLTEGGEELQKETPASLYFSFAPQSTTKKLQMKGNKEICEIIYKY